MKKKKRGSDIAGPALYSAAVEATSGMSRELAIGVWLELSNRFPGTAELARGCIDSFFLLEDWSGIDRFEGSFPDRCAHPSVAIRIIDALLVRGRLSAAASKLRKYKQLAGADEAYQLRRYELHFLQKNFNAAAGAAKNLNVLNPEGNGRSLESKALAYSAVSEAYPSNVGPVDYKVYGINLDPNTERLKRLSAQIPPGAFERIPGVKGRYLPEAANRLLTQGPGWKLKGSLGCFLSHVAAWERIAEEELPYGLVLEDDASVIAKLPPSVDSLKLNRTIDLLFVNERMSPDNFEPRSGYRLQGIAEILETRDPTWRTPGGDGYLLSKRGARILLNRIAQDGLAGDVDWRLLLYALSREQLKRLYRKKSVTALALRFHDKACRERPPLSSGMLVPPLVRQLYGGSVRVWDNNFPREQLRVVVAGLSGRAAHLPSTTNPVSSER